VPTVLLVRHGRTTANASGVLAGWTPGVGLDDHGRSQTEALGGRPQSDSSYGNGDVSEVGGGSRDVVHEIGCSWTGKDGATARAWVFAQPVDVSFARRVIASNGRTKGCRAVGGAAYGKPTTTQLCRFPDGTVRIRHAGLISSTWLTCELGGRAADESVLRARADRWCVEVVNALNTAK